MHPLVNTAITAARDAGNIILRGMNRRDRMRIEAKQRHDYVTEVDQAAELAIIDLIQQRYPDHAILGEESGQLAPRRGDRPEVEWIIDPLDGTTNYIHGLPHFAVSIGIRERGRLEHGVIFDPLRNELYTATRGRGAQLDGKRLRLRPVGGLDGALIGTGLPFRESDKLDAYMATLRRMMTRTAGIRRGGSAALDLAFVAAGRLDGFWEIGLKPWDLAAGVVMIQEAGGIVGDLDGRPDFMQSGDIVAGTPKVFAGIVREIQAANAELRG